MLGNLSERYSVILMDTPAANNSSDALILAERARGVVVVTRRHHTPLKAVRKLSDELKTLGTNVVGTVLNLY